MAAWKELKTINSEMIVTDDYQRPLSQIWVDKIAGNFAELKANLPKVSFRDRKYYVFDGQHTIAARIKLNKGKPVDIRCEVYHGLSHEEEAGLFVSLNSDKKKTTLRDNIKAAYIEQRPDVVEMVKVVEGAGFKLAFRGENEKNFISAVGKVESIYKKHGREGLMWVLELIRDTWDGEKMSLKAEIIGGVGEVYRAYRDDIRFSRDRFIKKLQTVPAVTIIREGKELVTGGDTRYAKRMVFYYNKQLKPENRLDATKAEK